MKLKDLIANRDILAKYDELKWWRSKFAGTPLHCDSASSKVSYIPHFDIMTMSAELIPDYIRQIIINALDAEIKKMEEE